MSINFGYLKSKLNGVVDILPPSIMSDCINNALQDIYTDRSWGFLMKEGYLRTPELIDQGTAGVVKFSETVTLDSVASNAVAAITVDDVNLVGRQFRIQSATITGKNFNYTITAFDDSDLNAIQLTIDPPFLDATNATAKFQILKIYYNPPETTHNNETVYDFKFWKFFINLKLQRKLNLTTTLQSLNDFDPARSTSIGEPCLVVSHPPDSDDDFPKFELYPAPRFERVYRVIYQRKGLDLVEEADTIPSIIGKEIVIERAKYRLYEYALANVHKYPELKGSAGRFQNLMALVMNANNPVAYPALLEKLGVADENAHPKAYMGDYMRLDYMDSCFGNLNNGEYLSGNYGFNQVALIDF